MNETIEIEYKTLLKKTEYDALIQEFCFAEEDFFVQTNHYFDTKNSDLYKQGLGLRIRLFETEAEFTLKSPLPIGLLETTQKLSLEQAEFIIDKGSICEQGAVQRKLKTFDIDLRDVRLIASLKTKRAEILLSSQNLLVLDESWYHGKHDYELEIEVQEAEKGLEFFLDFLKERNLHYNSPANKIVRAIQAKKHKSF